MEVQYLIRTFRPYWRIVLAMTLLGLLAGIGVTYIKSPRYTGAVHLQILPDATEPRTVSIRMADIPQSTMLVTPQNPADAITQEAIERLESRPVHEEVIRRLHLDEPKPPRNTVDAVKRKLKKAKSIVWDILRYGMYKEPTPFQAAIETLAAAVKAQRVENSYVLEVSAQADSPELAVAIANTVAEVYLEHAQKAYEDYQKERRAFLKEQEARSAEDLARARAEFLQYSLSKGVLSSPEQIKAQVKTVDDLLRDMRENDLALQAAQIKLETIRAQRQNTNPYIETTDTSEGTTRENVTQGETQNVTGGDIRTTSSGTTTTTSRQTSTGEETVRDTGETQTSGSSTNDSAAASARETTSETTRSSDESRSSSSGTTEGENRAVSQVVTEEIHTPVRSERTSRTEGLKEVSESTRHQAVNLVYQQLQQTELELEREIQGMQALDTQLREQFRQLQGVSQELIAEDSRLAELAFNVELASKTHESRVTDLNQSILASRPVYPAYIIEPATPPRYPSGRYKFYFALAGMAIGFILSTSTVLLVDYARTSVRSPLHAETALGLPVLAMLPPSRILEMAPPRPGALPDTDVIEGRRINGPRNRK
jgi:uncharacterized protein involved in exopolysaccharide biosynthesis